MKFLYQSDEHYDNNAFRCRVLPSGKCNGMIPDSSTACIESFTTVAETVSRNIAVKTNVATNNLSDANKNKHVAWARGELCDNHFVKRHIIGLRLATDTLE